MAAKAKRLMDDYERQKRLLHPNDDPFGSEGGQKILAEYRRINQVALSKLDTGFRFMLMLGQPSK